MPKDDKRKELTQEDIKSVNNTLLPKTLLGRFIDEETLNIMENCGIDVCGENGEYHTLTIDGPIFLHSVFYPHSSSSRSFLISSLIFSGVIFGCTSSLTITAGASPHAPKHETVSTVNNWSSVVCFFFPSPSSL